MNQTLARTIVRERSGGRCEAGTQDAATDWSHRVAKGRLGLWTPSNGLHLCPFHHHGVCHAEPDLARELGWIVRTGDEPSERPAFIVTQAYGWAWVLLAEDGTVAWVNPEDYGLETFPKIPTLRP